MLNQLVLVLHGAGAGAGLSDLHHTVFYFFLENFAAIKCRYETWTLPDLQKSRFLTLGQSSTYSCWEILRQCRSIFMLKEHSYSHFATTFWRLERLCEKWRRRVDWLSQHRHRRHFSFAILYSVVRYQVLVSLSENYSPKMHQCQWRRNSTWQRWIPISTEFFVCIQRAGYCCRGSRRRPSSEVTYPFWCSKRF